MQLDLRGPQLAQNVIARIFRQQLAQQLEQLRLAAQRLRLGRLERKRSSVSHSKCCWNGLVVKQAPKMCVGWEGEGREGGKGEI